MSDGSAVEPPLVSFSPPEKPLSLLQTIKVARENGMATVPRGAYEDLIYEMKSIAGNALVVSDPVGVKRILLDNVANYPKTPSDAPFLSAAFGSPVKWEGRDMRKAHANLPGLNDSHFDAVAENLKATLEELKVKKELVDQIMALAGSLRNDVLNRKPAAK